MTDTARVDPRSRRVGTAPYLGGVASIRSANIGMLVRQVVFVILLTRSACDPIFEMSGVELGGSSIGFGAVINALVIMIAALSMIQRPSAAPFAAFGIWAPYLLVAFGATLYAPSFAIGMRTYLVILSYWAMFALPFLMFQSRADLPRFVLVILASSIIPSLYALWDIGRELSDLSDFRLQSTFMHPNIYAFYLVLLIGLALYIKTSTAVRWSPGVRSLVTMYIPVLLLFLALTQTRSAWAACGLILLVYAMWFERRLLLGLLVLPILLSSNTIVGNRLADLSEGEEIQSLKELNDSKRLNSFTWREALWTSALPSITESPIVGHGIASFKPSTPQFFLLAGPDGIDAHNMYLETLFEMGLIGVLAFVWLLASLVYWLKKGLHHDRNGIVIVFSILAAYVLESYSDNMRAYLSFNWYLMFLMGTICAWIGYQERRPKRHSRDDSRDRSEAAASRI